MASKQPVQWPRKKVLHRHHYRIAGFDSTKDSWMTRKNSFSDSGTRLEKKNDRRKQGNNPRAIDILGSSNDHGAILMHFLLFAAAQTFSPLYRMNKKVCDFNQHIFSTCVVYFEYYVTVNQILSRFRTFDFSKAHLHFTECVKVFVLTLMIGIEFWASKEVSAS